MTFPDHKSLDELKQQSVFELLGALDELESAQFDRDFREVPASVQADLRRIQAEVAVDPALLAAEDPAASLRARTVAALMTAIEAHESEEVVRPHQHDNPSPAVDLAGSLALGLCPSP